MLLGRGLDPYRQAIQQQKIIGLGFGDDTAAYGHDHPLVVLNDPLQATPLDAPVTDLTVERKDLVQAHAGFVLYLLVQFYEGIVVLLGERYVQSDFAGISVPSLRY